MKTVPRAALPRLTDRLALGESGLRVSPVCLGIVESPEVVPAAFDAGVNFFFVTADLHWPLYERTRRGLELLTRPTKSLLFNFTNTQGYVSDDDWSRPELPDLGWRPTLTDHYRFALTRPEMDGLLVSLGEVTHVAALATALAQGPLAPDEELAMLEVGRLLRAGRPRVVAP